MGMGDKKQEFHPQYEPILCDVTLKKFPPYAIRACPNPSVIKRYGTGGVANVCVYVCYKCKYARRFRFHGGVGCSYGLEERVQGREKS